MKVNINLTPVEIYQMVLSGKLKRFPLYFWTKPESIQNAKEITKYFIEDILRWTEEDLTERLSEMTFRKAKLSGMLEYVFGRSPYKAINSVYPHRFKPWQFNKTPLNFWNDDTALEAIKWLMDKKDLKEIIELKQEHFKKNKLSGLYTWMSDNNKDLCYYSEIIHPNKYRKWHFNSVGNDYWQNKENAIEAVRWLVEEVIKSKTITIEHFYNNGLYGLITERYNGSIYLALKEAYPNKEDWNIRKSKFLK